MHTNDDIRASNWTGKNSLGQLFSVLRIPVHTEEDIVPTEDSTDSLRSDPGI